MVGGEFLGGVIYTNQFKKVNRQGGVDVTDDIMLNISEESLKNNEVVMLITNELFIHPNKDDRNTINKTLVPSIEQNLNIQEAFVGLFVNTDEFTEPHLVIGLKVKFNFDDAAEEALLALRKKYRKHVFFEFINLDEEFEFMSQFREQALRLK